MGVDVHRAARIAAAGHGGQVLISSATGRSPGGRRRSTVSDLGEHRLKDLAASERIYQLGTEQHPRLRSLSPTNLPEPVGKFVGRWAELLEIGELLRDPSDTAADADRPGRHRQDARCAARGGGGRRELRFQTGRWWVPAGIGPGPGEWPWRLIGRVLGLSEGAGLRAISQYLADASDAADPGQRGASDACPRRQARLS